MTTLVIYDANNTSLVTHTLTGFTMDISVDGTTYVMTSNAIADATIANTGDASYAKLIGATGEVTLTVGTSGSDVNMSSLACAAGANSSISLIILNAAKAV